MFKKRILFIVGQPRSGTTSLAKALGSHSSFYLPKIKEPHFFLPDKSNLFSFQGKKKKFFRSLGFVGDLNQYEKSIRVKDTSLVSIDGSTLYSSYFESINLISSYCSKMDPYFILLKRNKFDRAYSHYLYHKSRGEEPRSFKEAINDEMNNKHPHWIIQGYVRGSCTEKYEQELVRVFGEDKVIIHDISNGMTSEFLLKVFGMLDLCLDENIVVQNLNKHFYIRDKRLRTLRILAKNVRQRSPMIFDNFFTRKCFSYYLKAFSEESAEKATLDEECLFNHAVTRIVR